MTFTNAAEAIACLRLKNPWVTQKASIDNNLPNFFCEENKSAINSLVTSSMQVLELGSFVGNSTKYLADRSKIVFAVDHWLGSDVWQDTARTDIQPYIDSLYDIFLYNCWSHKDKIVPVRMSTSPAMTWLNDFDVDIDLVYVDAGHTERDVYNDLVQIKQTWPHAIIIGDDYYWTDNRNRKPVLKAVTRFAEDFSVTINNNSNCWWVK